MCDKLHSDSPGIAPGYPYRSIDLGKQIHTGLAAQVAWSPGRSDGALSWQMMKPPYLV